MKRFVLALVLFFIVPAPGHAETYRFARLWPTLNQPWYFNFPNAVATDSQEYVYVADSGNKRVVKFTAGGQFVSSWAGSPDDGVYFHSPYGIAIDQADRIYVSDDLSFQVLVFDTAGRLLRKWYAEDGDGKSFRPTGIAADNRGYIYLVDSSNARVLVYTDDGLFVGGWNDAESGNQVMTLPEGVAVDEQGNAFVTDIEGHSFHRFSVTISGDRLEAVPMGQWGEFGTETEQFRNPAGIALRDGEVFVVDIRNDRVQVYDYQGNFLRTFGMIGDAEGQFYASTGIDITPGGTVYVAGKNRRRIQKFRVDGSFLSAWQSMGTADGKLQLPRGLDTDEAGNLYVADKNNSRIQVFSPEGVHLSTWGKKGDGEKEFNLPFDLLVSGNTLFVADTNNHRIQSLDLQGNFKEEWVVGEGGERDTPYNLAMAPDGTLFVTVFQDSQVHKLIPDVGWGEPWDQTGQEDAQLANPQGIAIQTVPDSDDYFVWVSDRRDRLQKFDPDGNFIEAWNYQGKGETQLDDPEDIWIENERVYVADALNNRIQVYDFDGNHLESIGEFGSGPGQFRTPTDLCFYENRLYVTDSDNNRIQVFERVETVANRKAILVAGGGPYEGNLLWDATRLNAGFALRALAFQGFAAPDIRYLTEDEQSDLDFDGNADPVFDPTLDELATAVEWAGDADQVVIYLVNHGGVNPEGAGVFRMSKTENLTGAALSGLLGGIQTGGKPEIILVSDFCAAGRFLEDVAEGGAAGRILVSSTTGDEEAYFLGQGAGSFSHGFWSGVFNGLDVRDAFAQGREGVAGDPPLQRPALDVDGDGADDGDDPQAGRGKFIGNAASVSGVSAPTLMDAAAEETENGVVVRVSAEDSGGISRVWVVVRPPGDVAGSDLLPPDTPILELPALDLLQNPESGEYEGILSGLTEIGRYTLLFFATDRDGNTSPPTPLLFDLGTPIRRKAVLLATGDPASPEWPAMKNAIRRAHGALRFQGYAEADIRAFAPETFFEGIFGAPSLEALDFALTEWIEDDVREVVFFWIGEGDADGLAISDGEVLLPGQLDCGKECPVKETGELVSRCSLDCMLDELQTKISGPVVVIGDSDGAGGWISDLAPPEGKERIVLTSASADGTALRSPEGAISFSSLFWKEILAGRTVGRAFLAARNAAAFFGDGLETGPQWDDNGNGIAGERGEGNLALRTAIGAGIQLAANDPTAAAVSEETIVAEDGQPVPIRISDVQSGSGTVSVNAVVASPDGTTTEIPLALEGGTGGYTGEFDGFTASGHYPVSYFAVNADGAVSSLGGQTIFQPFGEDVMDFGDASDDSAENATLLVVNDPSPDHHNFIPDGDVDQFRFFAIQGETYTIRATKSEGADPFSVSLRLFRETKGAGADALSGTGNYCGTVHEREWDWECTATGVWRIEAEVFNQPAEENPTTESCRDVFGPDTGYTLQVLRNAGSFAGFLQGAILDAETGTALSNVRLRTSANASALTRPNGRFLMIQEPGEFVLTIEADGYQTLTRTVSISDLGTTELDLALAPVQPEPPEPDPTPTPVFPVAAFSAEPVAGEAPLSVQFADRSTIASGSIFRRDWDFGDGTASSESEPVHVYEEPGTYTVRLRVFSSDGYSDTEIRTDLIAVSRPGAPVADFGMSPATGTAPFDVSLTDRSTGEIAERIWRADGEVFAENVADPTYIVEECRDIGISLTVAGPGGTDEISRIVVCADETPETGTIRGRIYGIPENYPLHLEIGDRSVSLQGEGEFELELPPGDYPLVLAVVYPATGTSETHTEHVNIAAGETLFWEFTIPESWNPPLFRPISPAASIPDPATALDSFRPILLTAQFVPVRDGQSLSAAEWRVFRDGGLTEVTLHVVSEEYLTELPVPLLVLKPETDYQFHVRFTDKTGAESEWSAAVDFRTPADPEDANGDGVPDAQAVPPSEIGDSAEDGIRWLHTAGGDSRVGVQLPAPEGTVTAARALHPDEISESAGRPEFLPLGLVAFRCEIAETGGTVSAVVHFTREIPSETGWVLADLLDDWQSWAADRVQFASDRKSVALTLTDGGSGDVDGVANGIVVAPASGPGTPPVRASVLFEGPSGDDVGGAGCFLTIIKENRCCFEF